MMPAQSTDWGQRVEHVWHETHAQMASEAIAFSKLPSWSARTTWLGAMSMPAATGQPAVHFPHW